MGKSVWFRYELPGSHRSQHVTTVDFYSSTMSRCGGLVQAVVRIFLNLGATSASKWIQQRLWKEMHISTLLKNSFFDTLSYT